MFSSEDLYLNVWYYVCRQKYKILCQHINKMLLKYFWNRWLGPNIYNNNNFANFSQQVATMKMLK